MKKRILALLIIVVLNGIAAAQETKSFDFIIMVDDEIWTTPTSPEMILKDSQGNTITSFSTDYHAGNLSIADSNYQEMLSENIGSINMVLKYSRVCGDDIYSYDYEIDFKSGWLQNYFFILKIYNTDRKVYRKIYEPLAGKNYTFEFDSSNGQMLRVTKKKRKSNTCN